MSRKERIEKSCLPFEICTLGGKAPEALNVPLRMSAFVIGDPPGSRLAFFVAHAFRLAAEGGIDSLFRSITTLTLPVTGSQLVR